MKKIYSVTLVAFVFIAVFIPQKNFAQCSCAGGIPTDSTVYTFTLSPTNAPISNFTFPQFDPSIGTLNCVLLNDTIAGVSTTGVRNLASVKVKYKFQLTVSNDIEGPGITVNEVFNKIYGPDSLDIYGNAGDTITYGPDTVFSNVIDASYSSSVGAYLGNGTVDFSYTINGGLLSLQGGLNYRDQIVTNYQGVFKLTYYWCPASVLATTITGFSATDRGKYIQLQWQATNDQNNTTYEIQYSKNGMQYLTIGSKSANASSNGTVSEYQYQYNIDPADLGKLYFRIKRVDASGKVSYTAVRILSRAVNRAVGFQTYPNPVVRTISLQFDESKTGSFVIELVNTAGQVMQQKALRLSAVSLVNLDLNNHPAKGLYLLRAKDLTNNQQYVTKVLID